MIEAKAKLKNLRMSAKKVRLVADAVRGAEVNVALDRLYVLNKKSSPIISKLIKSAVANANNKYDVKQVMNVTDVGHLTSDASEGEDKIEKAATKEGKKAQDILKETEMIQEGVTTTKSAYDISRKVGIEMPITEKIYEVLYKNKKPGIAVKDLMTRSLKPETI